MPILHSFHLIKFRQWSEIKEMFWKIGEHKDGISLTEEEIIYVVASDTEN